METARGDCAVEQLNAFAYQREKLVGTGDQMCQKNRVKGTFAVEMAAQLTATGERRLSIERVCRQVEEEGQKTRPVGVVHRLFRLLATGTHESLVRAIGELMVVILLLDVVGWSFEVGEERIGEGVLKPELAEVDHHAFATQFGQTRFFRR